VTQTVISGRSGSTWNPGYNSTNNHVTGATYDSDGNMTNDGGSNVYGWNEFSKMKWTAASGTPTCGTSGKCITYDAFGRMVETSNGSTWKELWYTQVLGSVVSMSGTTENYAYWPSPGRGTFVDSGSKSFLHQDWLGNDRIASSPANHNVSADRAYAPYGEQYNTFGSTNPINGIFAGITGDYDSGILFDAPNRELAQYQGRWLSPDPAGSGWNEYAYSTNPNTFRDPSGLAPVDCLTSRPIGGAKPNAVQGCTEGSSTYGGGGIDAMSGWFGNFDQPLTNLATASGTVGADLANATVLQGGQLYVFSLFNDSVNGPTWYNDATGQALTPSDAEDEFGLTLPGAPNYDLTPSYDPTAAANNGPTTSTGCTVAASCGPTANTHGFSHCTVTVGQNGKYTAYDGGATGSVWNSTLQVQPGPGGPPGPNTFYISNSCSMAACVPTVAQNINNANMWYSFPFQNSNTAAAMMLQQCGASVPALPVWGPQ